MVVGPRWVWLSLLVILGLAAWLRFWHLGSLPPGLYHDEAYDALDALSLLQGKTFPLFYEGWELYAADAFAERPPTPARFPVFLDGNYGREPLHIYLTAVAIRLFGATPFAARAVPAAAGVLSVLTTYLAAWAIFDVWRPATRHGRLDPHLIALLAALTLAILYPAVHFSRFGIRAMVFLPLETLTVFCFWRAMEKQGSGGAEEQRRRGQVASGRWQVVSNLQSPVSSLQSPLPQWVWYGLAGVCLGGSFYTYASARLFPLLFVFFAAFWLWQDWEEFRRAFKYLVLMAVAALVTAAPLLLYFIRYPYFFVFRIAYVANRGAGTVPDAPWLTWLLNVGRVFRGLFWQGETHLRHNLPGRPYLDVVQAVLFLLAIGKAVRRWRQPAAAFLLLWFVVMLLPSILSGDAPHFGRMTGVAPVVAIFIGWAAAWVIEYVRSLMAARLSSATWVTFLLVGLLFGPSLFLMVRDYFGRYAHHPDLSANFYVPDWELGRFAASLPAETTIYFTPTQEEMATLFFALRDPARIRSYDGSMGLVPAGEPGVPAVYLVRPEATAHQEYLRRFFPEGIVETEGDNFVSLAVPAAAPRLTGTEENQPANWGDLIGLADWSLEQTPDHLGVTLYWQALRPMTVNYTAFVHLLDEAGTLVAQQDRPPAGYPTAVWRPGEVVVDPFTIELPPHLPAGTYHLETGFYDPATLVRLGEAADLGPVTLGQ